MSGLQRELARSVGTVCWRRGSSVTVATPSPTATSGETSAVSPEPIPAAVEDAGEPGAPLRRVRAATPPAAISLAASNFAGTPPNAPSNSTATVMVSAARRVPSSRMAHRARTRLVCATTGSAADRYASRWGCGTAPWQWEASIGCVIWRARREEVGFKIGEFNKPSLEFCSPPSVCLSSFELEEFSTGHFHQYDREDQPGILLRPGSPCGNGMGTHKHSEGTV